jgi:arylsulfatase A-like enzyme
MNRRDFIKKTSALALGLFTLDKCSSKKTARYNLLVIHTDEHSFRTLACYRALMTPELAHVWGAHANVETPHIDWIAKNGALCSRFYAATPVCSPSRASLLTGNLPHHTGVTANEMPLAKNNVTFAEILRREGYATGYAGKWHLNGEERPGWAPRRKFGFDDNRFMFNRGHWKMLKITEVGPRVKKGPVGKATSLSYTTDFLADRAVDFIRANRNRRFCYMVSFPDPHDPNSVRPPYDSMYKTMHFKDPYRGKASPSVLPSWAQPQNNARPDMAAYFGMVKCIDDNVGKMLSALRDSGLLEKTIIVFTSDHGDMCGEHGRLDKGVPFEASARVPLLIYAKDVIKPERIVAAPFNTADFKPTILSLMGIGTVGSCDGRDASRLFISGNPALGWKNFTAIRNTSNHPPVWLAGITDRYKLILTDGETPCLFDLEKDPLETRNAFFDPSSRDIVRRLARAVIDYGDRYRDPYIGLPSISNDLAWAVQGEGPYIPIKKP